MPSEQKRAGVNNALDEFVDYVRKGGKALVITWDDAGAGSTTYNMSAAEARAAARETSLAREALFTQAVRAAAVKE